MSESIDVQGRLADADAAFQAADAANPNSPVPDGNYQARIDRFDFSESRKHGDLQLVTEMEIIAPQQQGRKLKVWHSLERAEQLPYTKSHLDLLGVGDIKPLSELEAKLAPTLDSVVEVAVKSTTKTVDGAEKTYSNTYVNKLLADVKAEAHSGEAPLPDLEPPPHTDADQPPDAEDDSIPF